jgi:hypothetical protein
MRKGNDCRSSKQVKLTRKMMKDEGSENKMRNHQSPLSFVSAGFSSNFKLHLLPDLYTHTSAHRKEARNFLLTLIAAVEMGFFTLSIFSFVQCKKFPHQSSFVLRPTKGIVGSSESEVSGCCEQNKKASLPGRTKKLFERCRKKIWEQISNFWNFSKFFHKQSSVGVFWKWKKKLIWKSSLLLAVNVEWNHKTSPSSGIEKKT